MESPSTAKHHRRRQEEQTPLDPTRVARPHRFHEEGFGGVGGGNETHEDDTNDEGGDGDEDGEEEADEHVALFAHDHSTATFLEGGRFVD